MKKVVLFIVLSFLLSCTSATIYKKPENLIPRDQMVALLTDMYIANSIQRNPNKSGKKNIKYMSLVYKKYNIDSTRFKESNQYYTSNIKLYKAIYQEVLDTIEKLEKKYTRLNQIRDSIKKIKSDSIKKAKKLINPKDLKRKTRYSNTKKNPSKKPYQKK
jgi:uncharacterized protein DUF4296